jgi:invasion protein IalB
MIIRYKLIFILSGLVIIGIGFFFGKEHIVQAALKEGQKFDDWTVTCTKDEKKKQTCLLTQQIPVTTKDDKTQIIAVYQIGYFGKDKTLKMIQIVPLGINLQTGTSIISGDKLIAPGKFVVCTAMGCQALADISDDDLNIILSNTQNFLGLMGSDGKQANISISNKGLKEGLEALK